MNSELQKRLQIRDILKFKIKNSNLSIYDLCIDFISVNFEKYIKFLNDVLNKNSYYGYSNCMIFSEDIDEDMPGYFGENKVCFEVLETKDIIEYSEFYEYIKIASNFYIEIYPEQKEEVIIFLEKIKGKYLN